MSWEFLEWKRVVRACCHKGDREYADVGGKGAKIHILWLERFDNFLADVGPAPYNGARIVRLGKSEDFVPGNVAWA